ncbi:hypothetical protein F4810DRAFT_691129 [Camillea tinctor]|nr:hypothetical protein F4810DRAFT_691129 [Camillea tinctor]
MAYDDGRALDSRYPMRIQLPRLEPVEWYQGRKPGNDAQTRFDGNNAVGLIEEWPTIYLCVDLVTKEPTTFFTIIIKTT